VPRFRILVAYEEQYLAYARAFEAVIRIAEPSAIVKVASLGEMRTEAYCFSPHLVISSRSPDSYPAPPAAWFRLSPEPEEPSEFRLGDRRWVCTNPDLDALTRVVDAVGGLVREGRHSAAV
jgi:hypothetical protein